MKYDTIKMTSLVTEDLEYLCFEVCDP